MDARLGVGRVGGFRLGDYRPYVFLTIDGIARRLRIEGLSVRDNLGGAPNTATMRVSGFEPDEGQAVRIGLGALDAAHQIFGGHILSKTRVYDADNVANVAYDLSCISHEWRLNRHKVNARFTSQSATTIATALIASYAPDFTVAHVVAGLPSLDEFTLTNEDLTDAFDRLTNRIGGAWYVDEGKDLHLFLSESATATTIDDTHRGASHVTWQRDLSQVRTRVSVEGGGSTALTGILAGETALPVADTRWYNPAGGVVTAGPQRITYAAVVTGGSGGLVGPGAAPSAAPALAAADGSGIESGAHQWAVTFITAAGESLPGPTRALTVGSVAAPTGAPTVGTPTAGGSLNAGTHDYQVSFVTSAGETTPGPASSAATAGGVSGSPLSPPGAPTVAQNGTGSPGYTDGFTYDFTVTFVTALGETTAGSAASITITTPSAKVQLTNIPIGPTGTTARKVYLNFGYGLIKTISDNSTTTYLSDHSESGAAPPSSNTAYVSLNTVPLTNIAIGPSNVTARKLYRRFNGSGTYNLVTTIANNSTTTHTDTIANASLGAAAPSSNTAAANRAALSAIPIGGASVTQRKVYRTPLSSSQLKLVTTIADNTTSTYTDTTADASLGANVPTSDTSGLAQPSGQVNAGSTSLIVAGLGPFSASGGWAVLGNGAQVIKYTGVSSTALTGIPASGSGAITASISYNASVTVAPALTGIPPSGAGAILYDLIGGDDVNLLVTVDDAAAQAALTALVGGDGIVEDYIQDRRLSTTEATARAQAQLQLVKDALVTVRYETHDRLTRSGRDVTITSTLLDLSGTFKIQSVTYSHFDGAQRTFPTRQVVASSRRFSFEALLRQARAPIG